MIALIQWFFTDDSRRTVALKTIPGSAWSECRRGDDCELRTESVVSAQQGTYQCLAINEHGKALSQCYVLVGGKNFLRISVQHVTVYPNSIQFKTIRTRDFQKIYPITQLYVHSFRTF